MHLSNKRILVTGAAGFIGSHVARACVREGAEVACILRPGSNPWRLQDAQSVVKRYDADLEDASLVTKTMKDFNPDILLHLATSVNRARDLDIYTAQHTSNTLSTLNLVRSALDSPNLTHFVHTGTIEEYGRGDVPFQESQREDPITPYSLTKHESVRIVMYAAREHGLPATTLRPSLTYGPLQNSRMFISSFIRAALTTKRFDMSPGEQSRDFLHVNDAANAYLLAASANNINGKIFNVATGVETKLKDAAEQLSALFNNDIEINYGAYPCDPNVETMRCFMENSKIREQLNWQPTINLQDGLAQTVDWYQQHASVYEHLWD
jgi:nucleoside-diphosphate-sugar epimerase